MTIKDLDKISIAGIKNINKFLSYFNITCLKKRNNKLIGCCPIHCGDNRTAFNMWLDNGRWKCRSHNCHEIFKSSFIGFIRGLLSKYNNKWDEHNKSNTVYSFSDTVEFIKNNIADIIVTEEELKHINSNIEVLDNKEKYQDSIDNYIKTHYIPCPFYSKIFGKKIVNKHLIGFCDNPRSNMYKRSVVPIFNIDKSYIIGYTGRSINKECEKCNFYHDKNGCWDSPKWLHDFFAYGQLYNIWSIKEQNFTKIILTESVGNCLAIENAGYNNVCALYGAYINKNRLNLLQDLGIKDIIYIADNRKAGLDIANTIKQEWSNYFNIKIPDPKWNDDICELNTEEIKKYIENFYRG